MEVGEGWNFDEQNLIRPPVVWSQVFANLSVSQFPDVESGGTN